MIFKETEESEKIDIHNLKPKEIALFVCMSIFSFIGVFFTIFQIATSTGKSAFVMLLSALAISPLPYIVIHNFEKKRTNAVTKIAVQVFISILLLFFSIMLTPDKNSQKEETTKLSTPDSTPQIIAEETTEETTEETKEETTEEVTEHKTEPPTETELETILDTTETVTEADTKPKKEIDVEIDYKCEKNDSGETVITIQTNLPDEAILMLTVSGDAFTHGMAQDKVTIKNGLGVSNGFSNNGEPLKGEFTLDVSMSIASIQSDAVRAVIGENGEFLTGEYVKESSFGGKIVSASFDLDLSKETFTEELISETESNIEIETAIPETEASTEPPTEKIIETGFKIDNDFISHHESEIIALATMTLDGFISGYKMSLAPQLWTIAVFDDSGAVMAITDITYNGIKGKYIYVGTINIKSNGSIESATPHYVSVAGYELGNDGYCNEFFENIS